MNPRSSPDLLPQLTPFSNNEAKSDSLSLAEFAHSVTAAQNRKDQAFLRKVFDRHAGSKGELSAAALMAALQEIEAPVLASDASAEDILRRTDANINGNMNGAVDFAQCEPALQRFGPSDICRCEFN
jgi:hypothetical protein